MKLRRIVGVGIILAMLTSSAGRVVYAANGEDTAVQDVAALEEITPEDISVTWEDSHVYNELTLGRYTSITTYGVKGFEDVPFISAHAYLDILCDGRETITTEDGVMKVVVNGTEAVIDPAADTIWFENTAKFRSAGDIDGAIVEKDEYNFITSSPRNSSFQEDVKPLTISLKEYHMPVIAYEDTILMPFLALQNTFGSVRMQNHLAYNGKDYYNAFEADSFILDKEHETAKESAYVKAINSGPFSEKTETTQAYADYGYYSICLLLDLTFGHKAEKNITTFDEYFTRMNAKNALCSTDPAYAMTTEFLLFGYLFDSGHDALFGLKTVFGEQLAANLSDVGNIADELKESEEGKQLFENPVQLPAEGNQANDPQQAAILGVLLEKGMKVPELAPLIIWSYLMDCVRPEGYEDERLDFVDDTAVIYFDAFKDNSTKRDPSFYLDPVNEEDIPDSTFAFFYDCFEKIREHEEVRNVVINISDNGGGSAAALISVLGFLSEDGDVRITYQDTMTGAYNEEFYHVDTNLDGIADDKDGFGGQYEFYIMCSGQSYSCGTALPYFAQQDSLATIIGTKPGGGDCVVGYFIDAYGRCAFYSSMLKLGRMQEGIFVSDEKATTPDMNMMPSILFAGNVPWFDPEGITDAVHLYQNGTTQITYNDEEVSARISEILQMLLERVENSLVNLGKTQN